MEAKIKNHRFGFYVQRYSRIATLPNLPVKLSTSLLDLKTISDDYTDEWVLKVEKMGVSLAQSYYYRVSSRGVVLCHVKLCKDGLLSIFGGFIPETIYCK